MPIIVTSEEIHPFLPSLGSGAAIDRERAAHQDIRPLEILIINLMADKVATERQLALWLGNTALQVHVTFAATDSYVRDIHAGRESKNTSADHIRKFYSAWSDVRHQKFDGLIVTGVNAKMERVSDEPIWDEVCEILKWSETNIFSSLFLCWGAQAALKLFHGVENIKGEKKVLGLFEHKIVDDKSGLLFGFPDIFPVPVARWKNPDEKAIKACTALEIVASSEESGSNIMAETAVFDKTLFYPKRVYVLNHPEFETETIKVEYLRDSAAGDNVAFPRHYFPGDDPARAPVNSWRHTAHLYTNWIKAIYEAAPYHMADIPRPFSP